MNSLVYLLVPLTVAAVVVAYIYWRDRKPTSVNDGIEQFRDGLRALAPESGPQLPQSPPPGPGSYSSYGSADTRSAAAPIAGDRHPGHLRDRRSGEEDGPGEAGDDRGERGGDRDDTGWGGPRGRRDRRDMPVRVEEGDRG